MINFVSVIVRLWVRFYTAGLESGLRNRLRQEIEADLWEQANSAEAVSHPDRVAVIIALRWILGIPADVQRAIEESASSGGQSMWTKKVFGVVVQKRAWVNLLILSGLSFSLLFVGIGTFIAGVFILVIPAVLLASPFVLLWPGSLFGPITQTDVWAGGVMFVVGIAVLVAYLHLSKLVALRLRLMTDKTTEKKKHSGTVLRIFAVLYDRRAWSSFLVILSAMLSLMFVGIGTFTAALVMAVITGAFIANPFIYPEHTVKIGPVIIDNPFESALLVIAGLGLALIILHLSNLVAGSIGERIISRFRSQAVAPS